MKKLATSLKVTSLLSLFLILNTTSSYAQGPWVEKKGSGFLQVQTTLPFSAYGDSLLYNDGADEYVGINREVINRDFGIYGTYGLNDKLTLIAHVPFKQVSTGDQTDSLYNPVLLEEGSLTGLGNLYFAAKYKIWDKGLKVATSLQTHLNTKTSDLDKGLATGYDANFIGLYGHVGGGLGKLYAFADFGYNIATNGYSDYTSLYLEAGYKFGKRFYFILNTSIKSSLRNGDYENGVLLQTGLYPNDQDFIGFGIKMLYEMDNNIGVTFGSAGLARANYTGPVGAVSLGVYKKW